MDESRTDVFYHAQQGHAYGALGQFDLAVQNYRRALELAPESARVHSDLGKALLLQGFLKDAWLHCREAIRLNPQDALAYVHFGEVLDAYGRFDESLICYREAVRLKPDLAVAQAKVGDALEHLGEFDQALISYREALHLDPLYASVLARLAARLGSSLPEIDRIAIERLLENPQLAREHQVALQFGLAKVYDGRREFIRVAQCLEQANALQAQDLIQRGRGYDPESQRFLIDQMIRMFSKDFFQRTQGFGLETLKPVFVVGMPRSGTSLVEQILASHSQVFGAGELNLVRESMNALAQVVNCSRLENMPEALNQLRPEMVHSLAKQHLSKLEALVEKPAAIRVIDKMPENALYLGLIALLFPQAKIIVCQRDLRDVALSCWMTHFSRVRWACSQDHIVKRIREYLRAMNHWSQTLPIPIYELRYESLVENQEQVSRDLIAWCDLPWEPGCLQFYKERRTVRTASVVQVQQPVYRHALGRWKNYQSILTDFLTNIEGKVPHEEGGEFRANEVERE